MTDTESADGIDPRYPVGLDDIRALMLHVAQKSGFLAAGGAGGSHAA